MSLLPAVLLYDLLLILFYALSSLVPLAHPLSLIVDNTTRVWCAMIDEWLCSFTSGCRRGRTTIVTLRCDQQQADNGTITLPSNCPDGTCDGCIFLFMWKSQFACPRCHDDNFTEVTEDCVGGKQKVFRIKPRCGLNLVCFWWYKTGLIKHYTNLQKCTHYRTKKYWCFQKFISFIPA